MKWLWLTFTFSLVFISSTISYAQRIERRDINPRIIIPGPSVTQQKKDRMPSFTPRPDIDYKIQRLVIDNSIDYKILDAAPRKVTADALRQRIRPPLFRFPGIIEKIRNLPSESVLIQAESHRGYLLNKVLGTLK